MGVHSKIGASGLSRWRNCPGSVQLSEGLGDTTSKYAAEGTVAHEIGEKCLLDGMGPTRFHGEIWKADGHSIKVTAEMTGAVTDYVMEVRNTPHDEMHVEQKFHLHELHQNLFGTSDCVLWNKRKKLLTVFDYKHGAGVMVEAEGNGQLMYYALGALMESEYPAKEVEVVIVQPRCSMGDPVKRWKFDAIDLLDWSADLVSWAKATEEPDAPLAAGDWCRWCPAAFKCPQLKDAAQLAAKEDFAAPTTYDPQELAEWLGRFDKLEAWMKAMREFAFGELEKGRDIPGHKLVWKRATRKWANADEAKAFLADYGMDEADICAEPKMKTPAQIEKVVGKANKSDIAHLIISESSGTTLVPSSDKREAVTKKSAAEEFGG